MRGGCRGDDNDLPSGQFSAIRDIKIFVTEEIAPVKPNGLEHLVPAEKTGACHPVTLAYRFTRPPIRPRDLHALGYRATTRLKPSPRKEQSGRGNTDVRNVQSFHTHRDSIWMKCNVRV